MLPEGRFCHLFDVNVVALEDGVAGGEGVAGIPPLKRRGAGATAIRLQTVGKTKGATETGCGPSVCLIPDHHELCMVGPIEVRPAGQ